MLLNMTPDFDVRTARAAIESGEHYRVRLRPDTCRVSLPICVICGAKTILDYADCASIIIARINTSKYDNKMREGL